MVNKTLNIKDKSEEHTKRSVMTKTHATKQTNYARKCLDDLWCICVWFECIKMSSWCDFLSKISLSSLGFLLSQRTKLENRESVIFIVIKNRASEKTIMPLKSPIGGFILRSWPQNSTAELIPRSRGPFGDHIRRSIETADQNPKRNRLRKYLILRFQFGGQAAD